jgi:hypothetical protein
MGKFKVGDRVRFVEDYASAKKGDEGIIEGFWDDDGVDVMSGGRSYGCLDRRVELVEQPWQPKVGDRVRYSGKSTIYRDAELIGLEGVVTHVGTEFATVKWDEDVVKGIRTSGDKYITNIEPIPTLTIESGKFYKTRDGRKVGPMVAFSGGRGLAASSKGQRAAFTAPDMEADHTGGSYTADGVWLTSDGNHRHDIIAEWIDEPAVAGNDNGPFASLIGKTVTVQLAKPKFKVGDRVRCVVADDCSFLTFGREYIVNSFDGDYVNAYWDNGKTGGMDKSRFVLVTTIQPTAIVALIEDGQPKPASRPYVHASEASAREEADRLASVHKGQQFGVYVLTTTSQEAAPTYKHEWQRLAAKGEKINAIKELRGITGLGLKSTKDAVEHWLANDEPRSRIAA